MNTPLILISLVQLSIIVLMGCSKSDSSADAKRNHTVSASIIGAPSTDVAVSEKSHVAVDLISAEPTLSGDAIQMEDSQINNHEAPVETPSAGVGNSGCISEAEAVEKARKAVSGVVGIDSNVTIKTEIREEYYIFEFTGTNSADFLRKVVVNARSGDIKYIWLPAQ